MQGKAIGPLMITEAIFSFWSSNPRCLQFEGKKIIYWIMQQPAPPGWGLGLHGEEVGLFPLAYVQLIDLMPDEPEQRNRLTKRRFTNLTLPSLEQISSTSGSLKLSLDVPSLPLCCGPEGSWRQRAFSFFEDPESSLIAQYWMKFIMMLIGVSVAAIVVESMNSFHDRNGEMLHPEAWDLLELVITMVFSFEYVSRLLLVESSRVEHILQPLNLVDLASITPFYIQAASELQHAASEAIDEGVSSSDGHSWMRVLRVARVFRVLKLGKYSSGLQLFGSALSAAAPALVVQVFLMLTFMVVCASLFFFVEQGEWSEEERAWLRSDGEPSPFDSIPKTFWWATVSMTTVGYGDVFPLTSLGRMVATVTMFIGVLSIAMPVSVVTSNFQEQYHLQQSRKRDGGKHLPPSVEFRTRYRELQQAVMQLHIMLVAVQRCAQSVEARLGPALQKSRACKIEKERKKREHASRSRAAALTEVPQVAAAKSAPATTLALPVPAPLPAPKGAQATPGIVPGPSSASSSGPDNVAAASDKHPPVACAMHPSVAGRSAERNQHSPSAISTLGLPVRVFEVPLKQVSATHLAPSQTSLRQGHQIASYTGGIVDSEDYLRVAQTVQDDVDVELRTKQ